MSYRSLVTTHGRQEGGHAGLAENSPLQSFSYACTQGLLSVNMQAL